jgi:hypothetical protein
MSEFEIAKPFNSVNRRFKIGAPINEADDITPFTFDERLSSGYIKPKATPSASAAPVVPPLNKLDGGAAVKPELAIADIK